MAVKVMQLESLLNSKQADLQRMGDSGQAWVQEACCLRDAVTSTLAALGQPLSESCFSSQFKPCMLTCLPACSLACLKGLFCVLLWLLNGMEYHITRPEPTHYACRSHRFASFCHASTLCSCLALNSPHSTDLSDCSATGIPAGSLHKQSLTTNGLQKSSGLLSETCGC